MSGERECGKRKNDNSWRGNKLCHHEVEEFSHHYIDYHLRKWRGMHDHILKFFTHIIKKTGTTEL